MQNYMGEVSAQRIALQRMGRDRRFFEALIGFAPPLNAIRWVSATCDNATMSVYQRTPILMRRKIYCNTCKVETHHELSSTHVRSVVKSDIRNLEFIEKIVLDDPLILSGTETAFIYLLWICRGCDTATLQEACTANNFIQGNGYEVSWTFTYHPKRMLGTLSRKFYLDIPVKLDLLYLEVIDSYNSGSTILCSIGLRALLEGICVERGLTDGVSRSLEGKLNKLGEAQHLPSNIVKNLRSFKFIGDGAAHRLEDQEPEKMKFAIEIMKDVLNYLYSLDAKAQSLMNWIKDNAG